MNISSVFLLNMKQCLWPRALACTLMFLGPLTLCAIVNAAGLTITSPSAGVVLNNRVSVTVNVPSSSNARTQKINLKVDDQFYRSQPYSQNQSNYTFELDTRSFKNGSHKLTIISIDSGLIVSRDDRWVTMDNSPLVLSNPSPNAELSGLYTATGLVRVNADKVNIKFDDNPNLVYSHPISKDTRNTQSFSKRIDTTRLADGPHTMTVRAVTNDGKDLKTIHIPINVQNGSDNITNNFDATIIPVPRSGAYSGVYTQDISLPNMYNWQTRLQSIVNLEKLVYGDNGKKFAIDRQFFRWNNLLNNQGLLNPYIKATSMLGRIPVIR